PRSSTIDGRLPKAGGKPDRPIRQRNIVSESVQTTSSKSGKQTPLCPVFGECGGCLYQDISYEEELKAKERALKSMLVCSKKDFAYRLLRHRAPLNFKFFARAEGPGAREIPFQLPGGQPLRENR